MYQRPHGKQNGNSSDKELIDISSDDDVSKVESKNEKESKNQTDSVIEESSHASSTEVAKSAVATSKPETSTPKSTPVVNSKLEPSVPSQMVYNIIFRNIFYCFVKRFCLYITYTAILD